MLLRFACENHRSIFDAAELSMIAVDTDRGSARSLENLNQKVVSVAGIYGANASGKSNVLDALLWLSYGVDGSLRFWDEFIPREPFRFGDGPERPSVYEIELMVDDVRYLYTLELGDREVIQETLASFPQRKRRRTLLERDGMRVSFRRGLPGEAPTQELLTPTTLALTAAMRLNAPEITPFARSLARISTLGIRARRLRDSRTKSLAQVPARWVPRLTESFFAELRGDGQPDQIDNLPPDEEGKRYAAALALLKHADLGIDDVEIVDVPVSDKIRTRSVRLIHAVDGQSLPFEMYDESEGTQTWFRLIGPVLQAIAEGQVLVVDEIDASLHPRLSTIVITLFQDPASNPRNAQLIFTAHDASLLGYLNRDEVWLTEKDQRGSTRLVALAEYGGDKVRRSTNLERAYLRGRFGGVPEADQILMRQALGLVTADPADGE